MKNEKLFYEALYSMRYNYQNIVTTYGICCIDGCKKIARGSGKCPDCIENEMAQLVGDEIAMKIHDAIKLQSHWINLGQEKIDESMGS